mmetsp:Transcript_25685/g.26787  ORF Transcript_25685/g.26787 Transcript_25685/m.26787 type:complete len:148 (-) Transcript_25685:97-540(-)
MIEERDLILANTVNGEGLHIIDRKEFDQRYRKEEFYEYEQWVPIDKIEKLEEMEETKRNEEKEMNSKETRESRDSKDSKQKEENVRSISDKNNEKESKGKKSVISKRTVDTRGMFLEEDIEIKEQKDLDKKQKLAELNEYKELKSKR